jgi:subtilisin family serine protease
LDDHGHGSHCAGTIGAKGDDGKGIVGVAWNVKLMGVKFLSASGSGSLEGAIRAVDYATKMGAKIMSNSWGGGGFSQALEDAIKRSHAAGALFVAAAGNNGSNNDSRATYPANYNVPNMLSVAAIDNRGMMASFSNYGRNTVHVGAPGVNITSSTAAGGYDTWSGTSMATPHVSGIASLLLSHEPNLSNVELKARIIATARPATALKGKVRSGGMANAFLALTNTTPPPDMNDPALWQSVPVSVSSAHPYGAEVTESYEVKVPGAKQIALYFGRFDTEGGYDVLTIKDSNGNVVAKVSGEQSDSFSAVIEGDTATMEFKSDKTVHRYGFDITKAAFR